MNQEEIQGMAMVALAGIIASGNDLPPAEASSLAFDYAEAMAAESAKRFPTT